MKIDQLILGSYETNCYVLRKSDADRDCIIIDTGLQAGGLVDFLETNKLNPLAVVLTHGHADHIAGAALLREKYPGIKVYIHKLDAGMLMESERNLSVLAGIRFSTDPADLLVDEPDVIELAGIRLEVLHTPGHTPGGICLYSKDDGVAFVGDTLFAESVGRTDFPGGSSTQIIRSIKKKILVLPGETICYTGHGPSTSIAKEKVYNPYLK